MKYIVNPSVLSGIIQIPPSKSHTMRAILFASLAKGESVVRNYLPSPDTVAMIHACQLLGAVIIQTETALYITGTSGKPRIPPDVIDAGNSGQVLRFIAAIAALLPQYTVITGDHSIRTNRPIQPLLAAMQQLGAFAVSTKEDGYAPILVKGPMHAGKTQLSGEDSQPVSALLMAAALLPGKTEIHVTHPGETPWIDLTLYWLTKMGIEYTCKDYSDYTVTGKSIFTAFDYTVPGDFSSAAFPIVAALLTHSEILVGGIDMQDIQGDKEIIPALQSLGADIKYDAAKRLLQVNGRAELSGGNMDINRFIDAITILAVMGCATKSPLHITGAAIAKHKESDRPACIAEELNKMHGSVIPTEDGLTSNPCQLQGATVNSHADHRIAMSLAVAALAASGTTIVENTDCVAKSFPDFVMVMRGLGANIQEVV